MPILIVTPDSMAETWLGALACADGSQMCSGNMPAFSPKPNSASQNKGARSARSRIGPEFPASGARREQREKREQRERGRMRRRQIKPARRAHLRPLPVERDQKIGADGEQAPTR